MSDLVVLGFDDMFKADEVLLTLRKLQREYLIDLDDAVVVIKKEDGTVRVQQTYNLVAHGATSGALSGGLIGSLIGLLFFNPLAGALIGAGLGAGTGAASGALADIGIDDDFIRDIGKTVQPGTSALFVLVRRATPDKVIEEVRSFQPKVLHTSLSAKDEAELKATLESKYNDSLSQSSV